MTFVDFIFGLGYILTGVAENPIFGYPRKYPKKILDWVYGTTL